jgi:predicted Zn-dependent peptidase
MVLSAAGNLDHDRIAGLADDLLGSLPAERPATSEPACYAGGDHREQRDLEQLHLVLGFPGVVLGDPDYYAASVLSTAFGGGMSSRLFQEIREKRGLAYSVYSFTSGYADDGMFGVYVGCHPRRVAEVVGLTRDQLAHVSEHGLDEQDLVLGRGQVRGAILLAAEDTESRMSWWGKRELLGREIQGVDAELGRIMAVNAEDVRSLAADLLARPPALAVVGAAGKLNLEALVA